MADFVFHTVVKGDTLSDIGQKYGVDWRELADLNKIKNANKLAVSDVIRIPKGPPPPIPDRNPRAQEGFQAKPFSQPEPYQSSWPQKIRGGEIPKEESENPFSSLLDFGERPPGIYPDEVAKHVFDTIVGTVKGMKDMAMYPGQVLSGEKQVRDPETGEITDEAIRQGVNLALTTLGGGAGGTAGPRAPVKPPLPEGQFTNMAGPFFEQGSGRLGMMERNMGDRGIRERMSKDGYEAVDPIWWETIMESRPPSGNVDFPPPTPGVTLGSGPVKGEGPFSNVVPFSPRPGFRATGKEPFERLTDLMNKRKGIQPEAEVVGNREFMSRRTEQQAEKYLQKTKEDIQARRDLKSKYGVESDQIEVELPDGSRVPYDPKVHGTIDKFDPYEMTPKGLEKIKPIEPAKSPKQRLEPDKVPPREPPKKPK